MSCDFFSQKLPDELWKEKTPRKNRLIFRVVPRGVGRAPQRPARVPGHARECLPQRGASLLGARGRADPRVDPSGRGVHRGDDGGGEGLPAGEERQGAGGALREPREHGQVPHAAIHRLKCLYYFIFVEFILFSEINIGVLGGNRTTWLETQNEKDRLSEFDDPLYYKILQTKTCCTSSSSVFCFPLLISYY